jgi:hypothetical protein
MWTQRTYTVEERRKKSAVKYFKNRVKREMTENRMKEEEQRTKRHKLKI